MKLSDSRAFCREAEAIAVIGPLGLRRRFGRGEFLFRAGEAIRGFFFVEEGEVRIYRMDEQGREVEVVRLNPGDFLAEAVMFAAETYPVFAQAVRETVCLFFERKKIFSRVEKDPRAAMALLHLLAHKCLVLNNRVEALGLLTVRQRLTRFLLTRCSGSLKCAVDLRMKKTELAKLLGTSSETLSRTLRRMSEEGRIEVRGRIIGVKNCPALRAEING